MQNTIKTLILEVLTGEGPSHIQEIHLRVKEFRQDIPQHTVRARLSEMSRSDDLEEKLSSLTKNSDSLTPCDWDDFIIINSI